MDVVRYGKKTDSNGNVIYKESGKADYNGVVIAAIFYPEKQEVRIGMSKCSKEDQFCKKIGRRIALGRAASDKAVVFNCKIGDEERFITWMKTYANDRHHDMNTLSSMRKMTYVEVDFVKS